MVLATRHEAPASALVGGRYRLGEKLGEGAAGVVWRARDERLDREVAVKQLTIPPGLAGAEVARMHADAAREGRIAARLDHPGVVAMLDMVVEGGCSWLVMEFIAGSSVAVAIENGPLPPVEAARIGAAVADALAAAHAVGVVHSDVKPTNVLLDADGTVKLADFGIACAVREGGMTGPDEVSGTPLFMAPEVARGRRPDAASDVFSLAATVYAMVEGRAPFGSMDEGALAMMHRVAEGRPNPTRRAGPLAEILAALFVVEPARRPTASMAHGLLAAVCGSEPAVVTASASGEPGSERSDSLVIVPLKIRPAGASVTSRASRMVPLTVVSAAADAGSVSGERAAPERSAAPSLTLLPGGAATSTLPEPTLQVPVRGARWSPRAVLPLSAAGVVALGAIAGTLGAGPGLPLIQSASDLLNRVIGTGDHEPASSSGSASGARIATEPSTGALGATAGVPVAAAPIVPHPDPAESGTPSDSSSDSGRTVTAASSSSSSSLSSGAARQLPVDAGVLEDVPLTAPVGHGLLSGADDGGPVSGVTDTVSGVTGGLSHGVTGVTGGLSDGVSGVTGGLTGTVSGLTQGLLGSTHGAGPGRHGRPRSGLSSLSSTSGSSTSSGRGGSPLGRLPIVGAQHSVAEPVTSMVTGLLGSVTSGGSHSSHTAADSVAGGGQRSTDHRSTDTGRHRPSLLSFGGSDGGDRDSSGGRHATSSDSSKDSDGSESSDSSGSSKGSGGSGSGHSGGLSSALSSALSG